MTIDPEYSQEMARNLLQIGAVSFSPDRPYTWASGLKSPVYCDNRQILGYPSIRDAVSRGFELSLVGLKLKPAAIVGTATAGIPHAAWLAGRLDLPMAYVRSKPKAHGKKNQLEGWIPEEAPLVVVEDLVSTGMSSGAVIEVLQKLGHQVLALLAIFSYGFEKAEALFDDLGIPLITLTSFEDLLQVAVAEALIPESELNTLRQWRSDPVSWSNQNDKE